MEGAVELDGSTVKKLIKLLPSHKDVTEMCKKIAFARFTLGLKNLKLGEKQICCCQPFETDGKLKKHISKYHSEEISACAEAMENLFYRRSNKNETRTDDLSCAEDDFNKEEFSCSCTKRSVVILYYCYVDIVAPPKEVLWQRTACHKLKMKGKIRVASEGINGTAEGCECAIEKYVAEMAARFPPMSREDFKMSGGDGAAFKDLRVTEYEELCSIGISADDLKAVDGGRHLSPEEFHQEIEERKTDTVLLDCRNFYESKIGHFEGAIKPDLRKFSYFPAYASKNPELFRDKRVLMYCTGGIRCERASAYIKREIACKEVLQLKGGIHKYLEKYPDGHYKGKLFVFDDRGAIGGESQPPVSRCKHCDNLHGDYSLCSSPSCRQLVLSCSRCRAQGKTACCDECAARPESEGLKEECECTRSRDQVPFEKLDPG